MISKGQVLVEGSSIKRYYGVGSAFVLAVNPDKAELEKIYGNQLENAPEYVSMSTINDQQVPQVRIDFIVKTDPEKNNGIEFTTKVALFLRKAYRYNRDQSKVQVIDKYGRTAWVTKEQCQNHEIPMYSNGLANIDKDYRPCYVGEEDLTKFIKSYLGIPDVERWENKKVVGLIDNPNDAACRLDNIENYFKGDFSELREVISYQPNAKVKILFGVRTTDDNKQYQSVYTQMFLKVNSNSYTKLFADVENRKANGAYSTTEFFMGDLKEYSVEATNMAAAPAVTDDPFTTTNSPWGEF